MSHYNRTTLILFVLASGLPAFASPSAQGIHNFLEVDTRVYRGAQPTNEGFEYLAKLGVKTIVDLREPGKRSAWEEKVASGLGMKYVNVPMSGLTPPTAEQISIILGLLEGSSAGPVFVHCKRGADRTGAVVAAYRIDHDHWKNDRALEEAKSDGMSFFQFPRMEFIRKFQPPTLQAKQAANPNGATSANGIAPAVALPVPAPVH